MEKLRYQEVKNWFWIRTWIWFLPAAILSVVVCYMLPEQVFPEAFAKFEDLRVQLAAGIGLGSVILGLIAAAISLQAPWMRYGWRIGFLLNPVGCGAVTLIASGLVSAIVLSWMQNNPYQPLSEEMRNAAISVMEFGVGVSILWGLIYGTWFAARRDKYFVEHI